MEWNEPHDQKARISHKKNAQFRESIIFRLGFLPFSGTDDSIYDESNKVIHDY
jgi:hypothetical protein